LTFLWLKLIGNNNWQTISIEYPNLYREYDHLIVYKNWLLAFGKDNQKRLCMAIFDLESNQKQFF